MNPFYYITYKDVPILKGWSTDPVDTHTGVDLSADRVYSYTDGVVLAVGQVEGYYCITIQYDVFNLLRYDHLSSALVGAGDVVQVGASLGKADRFVHFEYATKEQGSSKWSVRVGSQVYWKQNPKGMFT